MPENQYVLLELSNCWKNCSIRDAETCRRGCEVKFNATEVDRMPDAVVKMVIAHEIAHVYQYATGTNQATYQVLESDADDLADNWGFDLLGYLEWKEKRQAEIL